MNLYTLALVLVIDEEKLVSCLLFCKFFGSEELTHMLESRLCHYYLTATFGLALRAQREHERCPDGEGLGAAKHTAYVQERTWSVPDSNLNKSKGISLKLVTTKEYY